MMSGIFTKTITEKYPYTRFCLWQPRKSSGMHLDYDGGFSNQDDVCLMEDLPMVLFANPSVLFHALSLAESL